MSEALHIDRLGVLADALLGGYDDGEACGEPLTSMDMESLELAAAAIDLAYDPPTEDLPDALRQRLEREADRFAREHISPGAVVGRIAPGVAWGGWLAAAAAVVVVSAVVVRSPERSSPARTDAIAFVEAAPDARRGAWGDWALNGEGPEVAGVGGEVVWSEQKQAGYMRFASLPRPAGEGEVYQVWIVDRRGLFDETGQSARISGGVFTPAEAVRDEATGELIVPIAPAIPVQDAAAFAVTIERPGGTWVSDMSRRVVIAELKG